MLNWILMELYDDYEKGNIESLIEFANKTFPSEIFIGCSVVMFSRSDVLNHDIVVHEKI